MYLGQEGNCFKELKAGFRASVLFKAHINSDLCVLGISGHQNSGILSSTPSS